MAVTVTLIILILVLPGCNQKTKRIENTLRVSVVTYTHDDPFINAMVDDLKEELKKRETEERKIITSVRSADNDQKAQNEIVEEMIDAGCDILCVNLVDRTDPTTVIRLARQHDIPVIFFNREPVPEDLSQWNQLYYVGCEAKQSGEMQGEIAADYIKNHPEVDRNRGWENSVYFTGGRGWTSGCHQSYRQFGKDTDRTGNQSGKTELPVCRLEQGTGGK